MSTKISKEIHEKYESFAYMSQEKLNALTKSEYEARKEEFKELHYKYFPSSCLYLPRQKTEEEMQKLRKRKEEKKQIREKFEKAVATALRDTLDETFSSGSMKSYLDKFNEKLERECQ